MRRTALLLVLLAGCPAPTPPAATPGPEAPATGPRRVALVVNGRPITEAEVALRMRERGPTRPGLPRAEAIEKLVTLELAAQAAEGRGLDRDPSFQDELALLEAKVRDTRRTRLAQRYRMEALAEVAPPSEAEVQAFLTSHQARLGVELTLRRLTTRTHADAELALAALRRGEPMAEVAKAFPGESVEMGPLGFDTLPDPWWDALGAAAPGTLSGVIPMGEDRFVVLELVSRAEVPLPAPEVLKRRAQAVLQAQAYEVQQAGLGAALRQGARIEVRDAPGGGPAAPAPAR
jgi:hypothetical protein